MKRGLVFNISFLVLATILGNVLSLIFNIYISHALSFEDIGLVSLISSFAYITTLLFAALGTAITYKSGFLEGKYDQGHSYTFWRSVRRKSLPFGIVLTIFWLLLSPVFVGYFHTNNIYPFLFFTPVWFVGFAAAIDKGFLSGRHLFTFFGLVILLEAVIKLLSTFLLVTFNAPHFVYTAIPIGVLGSFMLGWWYASGQRPKTLTLVKKIEVHFPRKFFFISLLAGLSTTSFLSMDVILAKHFFSSYNAGEYALVSMIGKIIYFLGTLASQFVWPLVSKNEGKKIDSKQVFTMILLATFSLTFMGFVMFGLFSSFTVPLLFGKKTLQVLEYLPIFTFGVLCFTVSRVIVSYHQTKNKNLLPIVSFCVISLQILMIFLFHSTVRSIVLDMVFVAVLHLVVIITLQQILARQKAIYFFKSSQPESDGH